MRIDAFRFFIDEKNFTSVFCTGMITHFAWQDLSPGNFCWAQRAEDDAAAFLLGFVLAEVDAEAFDRALESFTFGNSMDVHESTRFKNIMDADFFAEEVFCIVVLSFDVGAAEGKFENGRFFLAKAALARLGMGVEADQGKSGECCFECLEFIRAWCFFLQSECACKVFVEFVAENFVSEVQTIRGSLIGAECEDFQWGAFEDRNRNSDSITFRDRMRSVVFNNKVSHADLVASKAKDFEMLRTRPVPNVRCFVLGTNVRPVL